MAPDHPYRSPARQEALRTVGQDLGMRSRPAYSTGQVGAEQSRAEATDVAAQRSAIFVRRRLRYNLDASAYLAASFQKISRSRLIERVEGGQFDESEATQQFISRRLFRSNGRLRTSCHHQHSSAALPIRAQHGFNNSARRADCHSGTSCHYKNGRQSEHSRACPIKPHGAFLR